MDDGSEVADLGVEGKGRNSSKALPPFLGFGRGFGESDYRRGSEDTERACNCVLGGN